MVSSASRARSLARHRPRVGPMLPTGMPSCGRHRLVVGARDERDDPQQLLAARARAGRSPPTARGAASSSMICSSDPGRVIGQLGQPFLVRRQLPAAGGAHPPRLAPGGHDQPADERRGVMDAVKVGEQAHPGGLQRHPPRRRTSSPAARATCHSIGLSSVTIWPSASSLPSLAASTRSAMRARRSGPGRRAVTGLVSIDRDQPAASQSGERGQASGPSPPAAPAGPAASPGSAACLKQLARRCARRCSGAANDVPLQTAKPPREVVGIERLAVVGRPDPRRHRVVRMRAHPDLGAAAAVDVIGEGADHRRARRPGPTQRPPSLNSALEPFGLSAPTLITGTPGDGCRRTPPGRTCGWSSSSRRRRRRRRPGRAAPR